MFRRIRICACLLAALSVLVPAGAGAATAKNVIMMIPDGCSVSIQTLARLYKGKQLNLDPLVSGMVKTSMASSVITGSAAAATAFSSGHKTTVRFLGVGPKTSDLLTGVEPTAAPYAPVATVLEGARLQNKSTGLVATSQISHATPAAFACHIEDRGFDDDITEHIVYNSVDVVFGGGARFLLPSGETYTTTFGDTWSGKRADGENLLDVLTDRGYAFVDNRTDMMSLTSAPVWGMFDDSHMDPELDRDDLHPTQPSLAEMTEKAIELLSQDEDGFFLVVEGSQVDWAGHANDPAYMVTDFIAFDDAVGKAIEFAQADGETLVMIFPDHNTGGLSIGHEQSDFPPTYTSTTLEDVVDPIKDATITWQELVNKFPASPSPEDIRSLFAEYQGSWWSRMTDEEAQAIIDIFEDNGSDAYRAYYPIAEHLSKNFTVFGWTTHNHTGEDVPLYTYGPSRPTGLYDNTELATVVADAMGFDLDDVTKKLYAPVISLPQAVSVDLSDAENPVLVIGEYRFPASKDYAILPDGTQKSLKGVTVYAPSTGTFYLSGSIVYNFRVADIYGIDIF